LSQIVVEKRNIYFLFFVLLSFPFYFGSKKHVQQMMDFFSFLV